MAAFTITVFREVYEHLLPKGRAWRIVITKTLRDWVRGTSRAFNVYKDFVDDIFEDLDPQKTRQLPEWEQQFGLPDTLPDEQERRDRLEAAWSAVGGQSPGYIQDTLQGAGFDVYVHEWWVADDDPTPLNPALFVTDDSGFVQYLSNDGGADMQDGDLAVGMDGVTIQPTGFLLVNHLSFDVGGPTNNIIPGDPTYWSGFMYIGAQSFPDIASVPVARRDEFETLILKIRPTHLWIGALIQYV